MKRYIFIILEWVTSIYIDRIYFYKHFGVFWSLFLYLLLFPHRLTWVEYSPVYLTNLPRGLSPSLRCHHLWFSPSLPPVWAQIQHAHLWTRTHANKPGQVIKINQIMCHKFFQDGLQTQYLTISPHIHVEDDLTIVLWTMGSRRAVGERNEIYHFNIFK